MKGQRSRHSEEIDYYFGGIFLALGRFRSVGDMSVGPGRGCTLLMCAERLFVDTCSPQNLQRALPGEM